jgi:choline dehydrogenase-like flavoprotein
VEDTSRGRVRLGLGGLPYMTYWLNRNDVARIKRGMEILFQLYLASGAKSIFPMVPGFEEIHDQRDVERFRRAKLGARDFELTAHHPLSTCRMGMDPRSSVVGPDNQVHHVPGLYIADGSSLPSSPGVNPQITIMALATRAARFVAREVE